MVAPATAGGARDIPLSRVRWIATGVALALAAAYVLLAGRHFGLWWGDHARWLHEVDRFAQGEALYRDFYWPFPPMAVWVLGGLGRWIGFDLAQVTWVMTAVFVAIVVTWVRWVVRIVPSRSVLAVTVGTLVLGIVYSQRQSAPIHQGMYTPAAPLGFLWLLLLVHVSLRQIDTPRRTLPALAAGVLAALCLLTKHDYWLPAAAALVASAHLQGESRGRRVLWMAAGGLAVGVPALLVLVGDSGWKVIPGIVTGWGQVQAYGGRGVPSGGVIVLEVAVALSLGAVALAVRRATGVLRAGPRLHRSLGALVLGALVVAGVWVAVTAWLVVRHPAGSAPTEFWVALQEGPPGLPLVKRTVLLFVELATAHVVPTIAPVLALGILMLRGGHVPTDDRQRLLFLLGVCIALRVRRGFEHVEWSSLLLELPTYVLLLRAWGRGWTDAHQRAVRLAAVGVLVVAGSQHWRFGFGPATRRGVLPLVATARGFVRLAPPQARQLQAVRAMLDAVDPGGQRPVLAFGYSGSFNYLLGRPAASALTHGFTLSTRPDPEAVLRELLARRPAVLAVDVPYWGELVPAGRIDLWRWERRLKRAPFEVRDRPLFNRLVAGCAVLPSPGRIPFTLYDCERRVPPPA